MNRLLIILLPMLLAGCATTKPPPVTLATIIRDYAFREKPQLNPATQFKLAAYPVEGLTETLHLHLLRVRYLAPDGEQFNERLLIYHKGQVTPFAATFGGHGLMSAVLSKGVLYYTFSWGSGRHRSHLGQLTVRSGQIEIVESGGFLDTDLFVRKVGDDIRVESGQFKGFNTWTAAEPVGRVRHTAKGLTLLNATGAEVPPQTPAPEQPATD